MRDIRFRAWDKESKTMITPIMGIGLLNFWGRVYEESYSPEGLHGQLIDRGWLLMQFTGLKDKNGKEIYEGDIVKILVRDWAGCDGCHESPQEHMESIANRLVVAFHKGEFVMSKYSKKYDQTYYQRFDYGGVKDIFEVIGNIYENPELIEEQDL